MPQNPNLPASERDVNILRGKALAGQLTREEMHKFLTYTAELEILLDRADESDTFGSEGWRRMLGWD